MKFHMKYIFLRYFILNIIWNISLCEISCEICNYIERIYYFHMKFHLKSHIEIFRKFPTKKSIILWKFPSHNHWNFCYKETSREKINFVWKFIGNFIWMSFQAGRIITSHLPAYRPSDRPSIRPFRIPCLLCSAYSSSWIHFIFTHLIKQHQKMCRV